MKTKTLEWSYSKHAEIENTMQMPSRYTSPNSIDNWRHTRMLDTTLPLIRAVPNAKWITFGDGRYGSDAGYLKENNADALATSLTDEKLRIAHEKGYISKFQLENAENISLTSDSVDFALCKESYHHFPRPPVALYEMLRVAKIGVILIEPIDNPRPLDKLKTLIKKIIRGDGDIQFEPSGNFLYRLNIRELGKLMTAVGNEVIAFKGLNDFYLPRLSDYEANKFNYASFITKVGIGVQNLLSKIGLMGYGLGTVVVFKGFPAENIINSLKESGFKIILLPKNPYLDRSNIEN